jgi:hypothetical protein
MMDKKHKQQKKKYSKIIDEWQRISFERVQWIP